MRHLGYGHLVIIDGEGPDRCDDGWVLSFNAEDAEEHAAALAAERGIDPAHLHVEEAVCWVGPRQCDRLWTICSTGEEFLIRD